MPPKPKRTARRKTGRSTGIRKKLRGNRPLELRAQVETPQAPPGKPRFQVTVWGLVSAALIVMGLMLGYLGQVNLANEGLVATVGLKYFFGGVLCLALGILPWQKEGLARVGLARELEWLVFGLILALAGYLRIHDLGNVPSGVFFDMGFQGLEGLRVLHEHIHPFVLNITESFPSAPVPIYLGAVWFLFAPNTQFGLYLMYALVCLASFPLIYWTFRQLAGPRVALLTVYILAVMRWNITFARNGFPPTLLPFFMFGCLALLIYGLRTGKLWAFLTAATSMALGLYAYQTHVMFPLLVLVLMVYEAVTNWKEVGPNFRKVIAFWALFTLLAWPIYGPMFRGQLGTRAQQLSIFNRCKQVGSWEPLKINVAYTSLMFNRRGDPNSRHNIQDHRQLDDVTGMLFFMGFFFALTRAWRRKYFWGLAGAVVMALPCLVTVDPAHSSRMHGMTPFVAFLAAGTLAAVWGRLRAWAGDWGDGIWVALAALPLLLMARQNIHTYFEEQAHNYNCWAEHSIAETMIGKEAAQWGKQGYDCFISPRYYMHFTVDFFTYFVRDHVRRMDLPDVFTARPAAAGGGLWYGLEQGRLGVLSSLQGLYPAGTATVTQDPRMSPFVSYFRVPPEEVAKTLGLRASYSNQPGKTVQAPDFPAGLPAGPYHATFEGCWKVNRSGAYRFLPPSVGRLGWTVAGRPILPGQLVEIPKGYYRVKLEWDAPAAVTAIPLRVELDGAAMSLDPEQFTSVEANHGLLGRYYDQMTPQGNPVLTQWDGVLNFVNGNDFPIVAQNMSARWTGTLRCPESGPFRFLAQGASGGVEIKLDGQLAADRGGNQRVVHLTQGNHSIEVTFTKPMGWAAALGLSWMRPGHPSLEVIPMQYFGETHL